MTLWRDTVKRELESGSQRSEATRLVNFEDAFKCLTSALKDPIFYKTLLYLVYIPNCAITQAQARNLPLCFHCGKLASKHILAMAAAISLQTFIPAHGGWTWTSKCNYNASCWFLKGSPERIIAGKTSSTFWMFQAWPRSTLRVVPWEDSADECCHSFPEEKGECLN